MPESIRPEKNILAFNQGLNTESSEIAFPDGFTTDERNYELLLDGSRRRRKGLAQESGGSDKTTAAACNGANQTYVWTNVAGDPDKTFIVHKFGSALYFTDDAETISTTYNSNSIDLDGFLVNSGTSPSMVGQPAQFTDGRGWLIVTGPGIYPIAVEYVSATDNFTAELLNYKIRDFTDQNDGLAMVNESATLSDALRYNLLNRGWLQADIDQYATDNSVYPNKSVPWHKGYQMLANEATTSAVEKLGVKSWSSTKYAAEPANAASANRGSLIISVTNTINATSDGASASPVSALAFDTTLPSVEGDSTWYLRFTTSSNHNLSAGNEVTISDTYYLIDTAWGQSPAPIIGTYEVEAASANAAGPTATEFTIAITPSPIKQSLDTLDYMLGYIGDTATSGGPIVRPDGTSLTRGPRACVFHDGRLFLAGVGDSEWSDYVFFSQIPDKLEKLARCYQEADPTDPENNQLVDTDGGWFAIQGIQGVQRMLSVRSSLLVFAENGVWEVSGGQRGFFTPSGYSIRKVTDAGCNSPVSPIAVQNTAFYTGPEGVFRIAPNQYTGILEATSVSKQVIQTKWNAIPEAEKRRVMSVYDDAKQLLLFLYGKAAASGFYDEILLLDIEIPAWYYYSYNQGANTGIMSAYAISYTDSTEQANKIKFSCNVTNTTTVRTCDHNQTDYVDFDGAESPLPYATTGWDNLGDFQRRRQAPIVTVYSKRTETGYTDTGAGWSGDNESSSLMSAYWDWTELTGTDSDVDVTGKVGDQQQVYRHTRAFTPDAGGTYTDGYPVVVTRNKVRGRGRVLQLRFDGEATKDSHIMGFTVNYRAQRAV